MQLLLFIPAPYLTVWCAVQGFTAAAAVKTGLASDERQQAIETQKNNRLTKHISVNVFIQFKHAQRVALEMQFLYIYEHNFDNVIARSVNIYFT